jgi:predicted DNA-binding transcriptional regulator YafY
MNELLVPFLMGLGGGVEVLGPLELRAEIAGRLREAVARYGDMTA